MPKNKEQFIFERRPLHILPLEESRKALGGKLPSIIENTVFTKDGLAQTPQGLKVPTYIGSGLGFNEAGRYFLDKEIRPRMEDAGAFLLEPFESFREVLSLTPELFDEEQSVKSYRTGLSRLNINVAGVINYNLLIPHSKMMIAILEGYPTDEGLASEIAYAATNFCPVIGIRTDFRLAENLATGTNPAVTYFMTEPQFKGKYFEGPSAYEDAYKLLKESCTKIINGHT